MDDHTTVANASQVLNPSPCHAAALLYAERGIPVFPILPGTKKPATNNGFYDASADVGQINEWWTDNPDYNVAFEPDRAGWAVIDLDGGEIGEASWARLQVEHGDAPETYEVRTPRGGRHLYFAGSLPSTVQKIGEKIDTRSRAGYVLLPPSVVDGRSGRPEKEWGAYEVVRRMPMAELPPWLPVALNATVEKRKAVTTELDLPTNIRKAVKFMQGKPEVTQGDGADAKTYEMACWLADLGLSEEKALELMLAHYKCSPQDERYEAFLTRKIANAYAYRQNEVGADADDGTPASSNFEATILNLGLLHAPANVAATNDTAAFETPPGVDPAEWARALLKLRSHTYEEGMNRPPIEYWPSTRLPKASHEGAVGLIVAESGGGKTTVIGYLAMEIMKAGGRVVYFPGEGKHGLDKNRIPAWVKTYAVAHDTMIANWRTVDAIPDLTKGVEVAAALAHHGAWLAETGGIAIFDTLKSATPGIEENSSAMGDFLAGDGAIRQFASVAHCTAVVAHHLGKNSEKNSRGHSSIEGNADFIMDVDWTKDAHSLELKHRKDRDGADGFSSYYKTFAGHGGVPCVAPVSQEAFRQMKPSAAKGRVSEVQAALQALFTGKPDQEPLSSDALAKEIVMLRERARLARAEEKGKAIEPWGQDKIEHEVRLVISNLLNAYSKPADGQAAELYAFAVKDDAGKITVGTKKERLWCLPTAKGQAASGFVGLAPPTE